MTAWYFIKPCLFCGGVPTGTLGIWQIQCGFWERLHRFKLVANRKKNKRRKVAERGRGQRRKTKHSTEWNGNKKCNEISSISQIIWEPPNFLPQKTDKSWWQESEGSFSQHDPSHSCILPTLIISRLSQLSKTLASPFPSFNFKTKRYQAKKKGPKIAFLTPEVPQLSIKKKRTLLSFVGPITLVSLICRSKYCISIMQTQVWKGETSYLVLSILFMKSI